jgi:hypothetical protein
MSIGAQPWRGSRIRGKILWLIAGVLVLAGTIISGVNVMNRNASHVAIADLTNPGAVAEEAHDAPRSLCAPLAPSPDDNGGESIREKKTADYHGISFAYPTALTPEIKAEIKPASPLEGETDKPEGVVPEHISFSFSGAYASKHASSYFKPEISIYSIPKYRDALALSSVYVQSLNHEINSLKVILARHSLPPGKDIPFMPFGIDASQAFHARIKYLDFRNGKGIIFLTQFNIEPSLINNQGLLYTFQGLTDDGLYYVSARFPVTAPFLPPSYESDTFENYTLPAYFYSEHRESNEKSYKIYLAQAVRKLEELPQNQFQPNLALSEELIRSLCIDVK